MQRDTLEQDPVFRKVSRRWVLKTTAGLTTGVVAAASLAAQSETPAAAPLAAPPDHDPHTGEIFDRERHHHWDTI
jgi:hypothetical protein